MDARILAPLVAVAVLAACGGGDDADQAADLPTPGATVTVAGTPSVTPTATAAAVPPTPLPLPGAAAPAKVPTTKATTPPKLPSYRVAMPDGRTSPNTGTDWKFANFEITNNQQRSGTVDVTYTGPGLASMEFTVLVRATRTGPFGELTDTFELRGFISAIQADATENVRLLGGGETDLFAQDATYEPSFTVVKVTDDDPKARPS
jgi:hypothetical protein